MIDIPVNAKVECTDGHGGRSVCVIIDSATQRVTHFVVQERKAHSTERLVPVDRVAETTSNLIRLNCTRDELSAMQPFIATRYVRVQRCHYEDYPAEWGFAVPETESWVPVEDERIASGELAVRRGADVVATDGRVGRVGELLADPESGKVTHLVLQTGHLWGEKELAIPVSAIHHVEEDAVYLKLDKQTIESLPAVPVRRRDARVRITDVELVVVAFDEEGRAAEVLQALKQLDKEDVIQLLNAAVIVKDREGKAAFKESEDVDAKHGALFGVIAGGLIGLVGGPAGVLAGAAAGAVTGGVAAHAIDLGFPDESLEDLQNSLLPGSSAIVALVEHRWVEQAVEALADFGGRLFRQALTDAVVAELTAEDETPGGDAA